MKIWAGVNDAGFAIMNSASYNIEENDEEADGQFMRLALQTCTSLSEFQALLDRTNPGGRAVASNFGVIDARGGAAYFETSPKAYQRFDATDPALAPQGFLVRSNFSDSGDDQRGSGTLRRRRASALLGAAASARTLDAPLLLSRIARDVANEALGSDPLGTAAAAGPYAYVGDSICRDATSAAFVIAGVKPGENALLATLWVILGQPITGVAVPAWVAARGVPAEIAAAPGPAPLTQAFDAVKAVFYPATRGELKRFVSVDALRANDRRLVDGLLAIERKNVAAAGQALDAWRKAAPRAVAAAPSAPACTTAVISGSATADGQFMRLALQTCTSLSESKALLDRTNPGGRAVASNFGVIDAKGGAAYFETSPKAYQRFDATDPTLAPQGYLVRSSFSDSGDDQRGSGTLRRRRASALRGAAASARTLDAPLLLSRIARDVANEALGAWRKVAPAPEATRAVQDEIARRTLREARALVAP